MELENRIAPHAVLDYGLDGLTPTSSSPTAATNSSALLHTTSSGTVGESEPPGGRGINDSQATAQYLRNFGTGSGKNASIDVTGSLGSATIVTPKEDDGAIPLANAAGLTAGVSGQILVSATVGDGPNGSGGTGKGDYDFYKVPAAANQLITVNVDVIGSTLNSVAALYDSHGTLRAINDDAFNNQYYGIGLGSYIRFLVPANDTYYVAVFGSGSGPQANPFVSSSGGGAASEGKYSLSIALDSPNILPNAEDNGSIPLATPTGIPTGALGGKAYVSGVIGDGPYGSAGAGSGDFDFYSVAAQAGQTIIADLDGPDPLGAVTGLDSIIAVYNSAGQELSLNDDDGQTFNSLMSFVVPTTGTYYLMVAGFRNGGFNYPDMLPRNPFDSSSGQGVGVEGAYTLAIQVNSDFDYYSFDIAPGDVFGANVFGNVHQLRLLKPDGTLLQISSNPVDAYPASSPLPVGGPVSLADVLSTPGRYAIAVSSGVGPYTLQLRDFRPGLEQQPVGSHQILYLDFSGPTIDASQLFGGYFPPGEDHLSSLASFLPNWGLTAADENSVIDAITGQVVQDLAHDVSGVLGHGLNGDYTITGHAGDFQIEILNSRDNPNPYGLYPNVSQVIVGGTLAELQDPNGGYVGVAPTIDVGNYDTSETAFVVLDTFSDTTNPYQDTANGHPFGDYLGAIPRAPGVSMANVLGTFIGNVASHEAGHFFGNWHTDPTQVNIMDGGGLRHQIEEAVGPDSVFGTADDVHFHFGQSNYSPFEVYPGGLEDTLNDIAFGLATGKQAGTYFDFVTGTLYTSGSPDDGHPDALQVKTSGANLQVYINGQLSLTRPSAGVNRVVLNGSSDNDVLDASQFVGATTLQGRDGNDILRAGSGVTLSFGGDGNDLLFGGAGDDVLVGGDGNDVITAGGGRNVLIGGRGSDSLTGGSGSDLLIAGSTAFDNNAGALLAVLAEWSSDRGYETRVANLRGVGTGTRANGDYFLKAAGSQVTLFDDDAEDVLMGGLDRDWYFARRSGKRNDQIVGLATNEFVDEI